MSDEMQTFLKDWRAAARLTQIDLAGLMGITDAQVSRIENGKRDCDLRYLRRFYAILVECKVPIKHYSDPLRGPPDELELLRSKGLEERYQELRATLLKALLEGRDPYLEATQKTTADSS